MSSLFPSSLIRPRAWSLLALACASAIGIAAPRAALAQPAATNLGTLTTAAPVALQGVNLGAGSVLWFKFTVSGVSPTMYLDIDDESSQITPADTMLALYDGSGNLVAVDDDNANGALSALSFGASSPARPGVGDAVPSTGQNGPLVAGTYYLALTGFPATFAPTGWGATSSSSANGSANLNVRLGPPGSMPVADGGPDQAVPAGTTVTLDASGSTAGTGCPTQVSWTQIAGPTVALNLTDPLHPTFLAPAVPIGGATLTFQLTVNTCPSGAIATVVNITVTNVNNPPVADAGPDQRVTEGTLVTLDGSFSFDPDSDPLAYAWTQVSGPAVTLNTSNPQRPTFTAPMVGQAGATVVFALGVSDGQASSSDTISVVIDNVNHSPVASAGSGGTFNEGTTVTLDASASSDPDGDPISYSWQQISGPAVTLSNGSSPTPTFTAPQVNNAGATLVFRVTVSDGLASSSANVTILIHNAVTPPDCSSARPSECELWPPNHRLVPIFILGVGNPCINLANITITSVTQDEPTRGLGDGDTGPDAVIIGPVVLLRAERAGNRNGRVYTINFRATNAGGFCNGSVKVTVPHDQGRNGAAVDSGQNYNSTQP